MQLSKVARVRDDATGLGQRVPASSDRTFARMGPISNRIRTIGFSNLFAVGNLDRGWLVALVWTRAEGEISMLGRFGTILSWCSLAIALVCWIAAVTIFTAIITGKLSYSNAWIAMMFFAAVGCIFWLVGRGAKHVLDDIDEV